ncbi:MAG TPA: histidine kinase [Gemmataceae bacterium]|jgi:hypothetical protein
MRRSVAIPARSTLPASDRFFAAPETTTTDAASDGEQPAKKPAEVLNPRRAWLIALAVCVCLGLAESAQSYWLTHPDHGPNRWWRALGYGLGVWVGWIVLWLIAAPLARRFPLTQGHWRGRLALHAAAAVACALLKFVLDYPIIKGFYCSTPEICTPLYFLRLAFTDQFLRYLLMYGAMVGLVHALDYYGKYRDGQLRAARLEAGLARARLQLLKSQLHPHFLFNTLNAISALVHTDVEAADRMLARLGDLLRLALEDFGVHEAPLARELEIVRSYLEIEQARLGSRLRVSWDIAPDLGDALVPTFLLQPLIENAIRHAIAPRTEPGRLEVRVCRDETRLYLEVRDDGPGIPTKPAGAGGVGLANTRARLLHLYGTAQRLELVNGSHGGCVARVILPIRESPEALGEEVRNGQDSHSDRG